MSRIVFLVCALVSVFGRVVLGSLDSHPFPAFTASGEEMANEFQLVVPEAMVKRLDSAYKITSVSPLLINNDDVVTVKFQTTGTPSSDDWIAAYSPADVDISSTIPVKFGYCDDSSSYMTDGTGYLTFNLTNLRADVSFYYFIGGTSNGVAVAISSKNVTFNNFNEPLRPRIIPSGNPDVFKLLWSSASSKTPMVKYGFKSGEEFLFSARATTSTFSQSEMCGSPASDIGWRDPGLIHTAELSGLISYAGQTVYYKFGDEDTNDYSAEFSFILPPLAGEQPVNRPTTIAMFGDLGRGSSDMTYTWNKQEQASYSTTKSLGYLVRKGEIDAVFHAGDISYARGYMAVWDFYANQISAFTSGAAYLTIAGNHEIDWTTGLTYYNGTDSGGECGVPLLSYYPEPAPATRQEPWWSYDIGLIHFVGMNTEYDFTIGTAQWQWLDKDLASVDRSKTPWVIFGGHRPMYINSYYSGCNNFGGDTNVMDYLIENIEPLLYKYKVNIAFWGHNHVVQRQSAVYQSKVVQRSTEVIDEEGNTVHQFKDPKATVHFVIGTGGAGFTENADNSTKYPMPVWNEDFFYKWGYTLVKSINASYLTWEWFDSSNNKRLDYVTFTQTVSDKSWSM